jgi:tRNA-dihydrouridine synthase B
MPDTIISENHLEQATGTLTIGPYRLRNRLVLAPMAGVTDLPFRRLCHDLGAGMVVTEMLTADSRLWQSRKSRLRLPHANEPGIVAVQIAGGDADMMADAARKNVAMGAQIIDINMGCPAKKVLQKAAGSALLRDEKLVADILNAVVKAVDVPVTLKFRTGWDADNRNAVRIAMIAEDAGIQALALHGRTRACRFMGEAEYETIARVVAATSLPVFANGDIDSPQKAHQVLESTGASGIMIGRAAQGNPWIFQEIAYYLATGCCKTPPNRADLAQTVDSHLAALHGFYGEPQGVRIARKHVGWYVEKLPGGAEFRSRFNQLDNAGQQRALVKAFLV